jgi:hypothetical protein
MSGSFAKDLEDSRPAMFALAQYFHKMGLAVRVNPIFDFGPGEYDPGDIELTQTISVKRLSREFTGAHDWPFGIRFIVDGADYWDKLKKKPEAVYVLNRSMTHAGMVLRKQEDQWERILIPSPTKGDKYYWVAHTDSVKWIEL